MWAAASFTVAMSETFTPWHLSSRVGDDAHDDRRAGTPARPRLEAMGTLRLGARVGYRPRGLQRGWRCVGIPPPRPRSVSGLPVERGRPGRDLRHPPVALPGLRVLERPRPHLEGAHLRPQQSA